MEHFVAAAHKEKHTCIQC